MSVAFVYVPAHQPPTLTVESEVKVLLNDGVSLVTVHHTAGLGRAIVVFTHSVNGDF